MKKSETTGMPFALKNEAQTVERDPDTLEVTRTVTDYESQAGIGG